MQQLLDGIPLAEAGADAFPAAPEHGGDGAAAAAQEGDGRDMES
jgi:hypothetical protein